ncbi:MAG: TetR/AcrR family transcriptional regulator, partial [Nannocystaceae bacterium]|nr:TetR/AcrR family transcriptional regulator [Nannocystaceae bacterium]
HGYKGTSIELLVEATGLHRSSLYGAFGPKEALYRLALQRYSDQQSQCAVLDKGPLVALERWFDSAIKSPGEGPSGCLVVNSLAEYPDLDDELRGLIDTHLAAVRQFFEMMARGLVPADRVATATDVLLGANVAIYTLGRTGASQAQLKAIAESALDTVRPTA